MSKKSPQLRFEGFTDDWEERKLGQYTKLITKGTTPKDKTGIGDVNFVKVENITNGKIYPINKIKQNEHDNYLKRSRLEEKDILFSIAGTLGRTAIVNKSILPANTNQALAIIRGYDFDTNFLITSLAGNVVKEYIQRNPTVGAQPNLSLEQVGNLLVNTPNAEEQQKIGAFFQSIDDTIALHQRKLDLLKEQKKGYLQKMFPKNGAKVPELRFAGFVDDWEERKLGDISYKVKEKNKTGEFTETLTNSAEYGIINQRDFFDKDISNAKNLTGYYVVKNDDFVYNPRISNFAPVGPIKRNKLGRTGVMSPLYYVFRTHDIDKNYFEKYFDTVYWHRFMELNGDSGARADRFAIKDSVFVEMPIPYPTMDEQQKIGSFFQQLDNTITLHQLKLDLLKEQKKGFLQKMFA